MTQYIIDTNVISAARRAQWMPQVAAWLAAQAEADLALSVVTVGEIERGIRLQEARNPGFAADLRGWLDRTVTLFADRLLPFEAEDALIWGRLSADLGHAGADLMIAAQALSRNATVVTRNTSDFERAGVAVYDPFPS